MNGQWAEQKLSEYLDLCDKVKRAVGPAERWNDRADDLNKRAEMMLLIIERIMREIDPREVDRLMPPSYSSANGEQRVRRCLGALRQLKEIEDNMHTDAPELVADQLHPLIWKSASPTWGTGLYHVAVHQATVALSATIKSRAASKLADRKLVQDVFAPETPKMGGTRLHLPGDREDDSWKSQQQGLHLLAQGAFAGIRNTTAHEDLELTEHEALEYLAVLSVLARWLDLTKLVRG